MPIVSERIKSAKKSLYFKIMSISCILFVKTKDFMTTSISQQSFAQIASSELLDKMPDDPAIQELAHLILKNKIPPANTQIRFAHDATEIRANFLRTGKLAALLFKKTGQDNKYFSFHSDRSPSDYQNKYQWKSESASAIQTPNSTAELQAITLLASSALLIVGASMVFSTHSKIAALTTTGTIIAASRALSLRTLTYTIIAGLVIINVTLATMGTLELNRLKQLQRMG